MTEKNNSELNALKREVTDSFIEVPTGSRSLPIWATYSFKYLDGKTGGEMFYEITSDKAKEYYVTDCDIESLNNSKDNLLELIKEKEKIDLIEFGAGNPKKAFILLEHLFNKTKDVIYHPIDIDTEGLSYLKDHVNNVHKDLGVNCLNLDFNMALSWLGYPEVKKNKRRKIVTLFGSTIGNFNGVFRDHFLFKLKTSLNKKDLIIVGFDLVKDVKAMEAAYNDKAGITERFNKNLLHRLNSECGGNFNLDNFEFKATYIQEPKKIGSVKSYLISKVEQEVSVLDQTMKLEEGEKILTEDSHKFTEDDIKKIAKIASLKIVDQIYDSKKWFVNVVLKP